MMKINEAEQIELLLEEANSYGVRKEVKEAAEKLMEEDPTLEPLDAYFTAYSEWIK